MPGVCKVILGAPVAAMNEENDGMRSFAGGHSYIHKLQWIGAIHHTQIGIRRLLFENVFALVVGTRHIRQYRRDARGRSIQ